MVKKRWSTKGYPHLKKKKKKKKYIYINLAAQIIPTNHFGFCLEQNQASFVRIYFNFGRSYI